MLSNRPLLDAAFIASTAWNTWSLINAVNSSKAKGTPFAAHPLTAAVGFSVIATSSYLLASPRKRPAWLTSAHQLAMYTGTGALYYALYVIWNVKNDNKKKHIQTPHSYFGIATISILTCLSAGTTYAYLKINDPVERASIFRKHKNAGKLAGVLFTLAIITGTKSFVKDPVAQMSIMGSAATSIGLVVASALLK